MYLFTRDQCYCKLQDKGKQAGSILVAWLSAVKLERQLKVATPLKEVVFPFYYNY